MCQLFTPRNPHNSTGRGRRPAGGGGPCHDVRSINCELGQRKGCLLCESWSTCEKQAWKFVVVLEGQMALYCLQTVSKGHKMGSLAVFCTV